MIATALTFAREELSSRLWGEMEPLFREHFEEIAHYKDIPLDPDYEVYRQVQDNGALRITTARLDGWLVGYVVHFVRPNPHYKKSVQAVTDVVFLRRDLRGGGSGRSMIRWADDRLADEGVQVVYQHIKASHNFGPMLERMDYELMDLIFAKRLDQ